MPQGDKGKYTDKQKRKAEIAGRKYSAPTTGHRSY